MKTTISALEKIAKTLHENDVKFNYAISEEQYNAFTEKEKNELYISYLIENELNTCINNEYYTIVNDTMYSNCKSKDKANINTCKTLTIYANANEKDRLIHLYRKSNKDNKYYFSIVVTTKQSKVEDLKQFDYLVFDEKKTHCEYISSDRIAKIIKDILSVLDNK